MTPSILTKAKDDADDIVARRQTLAADHAMWIRHPRTAQFGQTIKDNFEREIAQVLTYALQPDKYELVLIHARNAANYSKTLATLTQVPE